MWSGSAPTCSSKHQSFLIRARMLQVMFLFFFLLGQCEDPGLPENGRRIVVPPTTNNFTTGTRAYFICSDGYEIKGTNTRLCQDSGSWTSTTPECLLANSKMG